MLPNTASIAAGVRRIKDLDVPKKRNRTNPRDDMAKNAKDGLSGVVAALKNIVGSVHVAYQSRR
jgi:hypothetical protein